MVNNQSYGALGEQHFKAKLDILGIEYNYINSWCDFIINNQSVEVKTCMLTHKYTSRTNTQSYKIGRYDFTQEQRQKGLWCAFFVRHDDQLIFLGMGYVNKNSKRYISIHKTRDLNLISIEQFYKDTGN